MRLLLPLIALLLLGLNLRPVLALPGPLLASIQHDTSLSSSAAGLLSMLPVMAMGLCALAGGYLQRWPGTFRGVLLGALIIAAACMVRGIWWQPAGLIATALLAGIGIALVQALLPGWIKQHYPQQSSRLMGLYTTAIMGGAALAAASAAPLATAAGWQNTLALWSLPALLAAVLWSRCGNRATDRQITAVDVPPLNRRAWLLMFYFGIGTGAYTLVLAWLPPFFVQEGWSPQQGGYLLAGLTLTEVVSGLLVAALLPRFRDRRRLLLPVLGLLLAGLICMTAAPSVLAVPSMLLMGLGIGALFPLSLIVTLEHAATPAQAGKLMGFVQGGGYIIASLTPLLAGIIRQALGSLQQAFSLMALGVVILLIMTLWLKPQPERQ
ncbi:MFS transporter [Erwinia sorbitola]|uniref:MFS transporter n=1 Tax=Erwinia sorbitola TaxID=2681984 RepID=A0A6I6EJV0_9GAMM|nr:MFS transporter [Erwinia sorbitola]MTD26746.1 MFS transporter [Erwinia sorbitola]QGU88315.1 MFS transporter [Erwinia sorbitola]